MGGAAQVLARPSSAGAPPTREAYEALERQVRDLQAQLAAAKAEVARLSAPRPTA